MSNEDLVQGKERDSDLKNVDIADLRKLAKFFNIDSQRDWKQADYVAAIVEARDQAQGLVPDADLPSFSGDSQTDKPKPGHARVVIHRDPTPGHANSPVPLSVNGRIFMAPRGVEFNIPLPYVEVLRNAVQLVTRQKKEPSAEYPSGEVVEEPILSYPFQVISITPGGKFQSSLDQRSNVANRKAAFVKQHGRWPTKGELAEFEKIQLRNAESTKE